MKNKPILCIHCDLPVPDSRQNESENSFCCAGCEVAYAILKDLDSKILAELESGNLSESSDLSYEEMDHPQFYDLYAREIEPGAFRIRFHLEGIHCASCVFVIEKLPDYLSGVISSRVNLSTSSVDLIWDSTVVSLSEIARTLDRLGYRPHPAKASEAERIFKLENRKYLIRLGIAGACAGNVMLIAFALYAGMFTGMSAEHLNLFRWTSAALAMFSILGPGFVFFKGAFSALRTRVPHIDIPVALGITIGSIAGIINSFRGTGEIYFDSLTVLIFLLLVGRYIQFRQQHRAFSHLSLLKSITPRSARLISRNEVLTVPIEVLKPADQVEVRAGDVIPADGIVFEGHSDIDESILTGESRAHRIQVGDQAIAGTINLTSTLKITIQNVGENTRIGQLMNLVELGVNSKLPLIEFANRIAGIFVITVIFLAIICFGIWWSSGLKIAVSNSISLLIVTCPCALGLATPLALAVAQGKAAKRSILINSSDVFERLSKPGFLWLDKTGTLTFGKMQIHEWSGDRYFLPHIYSLEKQVEHPIATAITGYLEQQPELDSLIPLQVEDIDYTLGMGISGQVEGRLISIGNQAYIMGRISESPAEFQNKISEFHAQGLTAVLIAVDGQLTAVCGIGDELRPEAYSTIQQLKKSGWSIGILSGDHPEIVTPIAEKLKIDPRYVHAAIHPERKLEIIQSSIQSGTTVMVGDGVNDSAALAAASVGIAVHGGAEASLQAAAVYLNRPGLSPLKELIEGARVTNYVIYRNLVMSLIYNLFAAGLAIGGMINPLIAALLMPISSLTVLILSFVNRAFREPQP